MLYGVRQLVWVLLGFGTTFLVSAFTQAPVSVPFAQAAPDLSQAAIQLADLPESFNELPEAQKNSLASMMRMMERQLGENSELSLVNFTGYLSGGVSDLQMVISGLLTPLSASDRVQVDRALANPNAVIDQLKTSIGAGDQVETLAGAGDIGSSRLAFSLHMTLASSEMLMDYVVARRGPALVEAAVIYREGGPPLVSALEVARLLDQRVAAVVGEETSIAFRVPGPLVPALTTAIPTPLDISTRPEVLGANLLLAALLMLPFTAAAEVFTQTLSEHEEALRSRLRLLDWIKRLQERLERAAQGRLGGRPTLLDWFKITLVVFFYGLVFSLLDPTWKPFSPSGLVLFASMAIAYGLVGLADDLTQWRAIRRWGVSAEFAVRPTNVLMSLASTAASRLLWMVPGLMFGTPEALQVDEAQLDAGQLGRLVRKGLAALVWLGLGSWLMTVGTTIAQRAAQIAEVRLDWVGGLEAFLLVLFAVTLENLFVQMLGFPGGYGEAIRKRSRWLWLAGLLAVTFVFYHTLINPRGELAEALQKGNIRLFFGIAVGFMLGAFGLRAMTRPVRAGGSAAAPDIAHSAPAASPVAQTQVPTGAWTPYALDGAKTCPACRETIKARARLCRFCRATFEVYVRGYCLQEHSPVDLAENTAAPACPQCGGQLLDVHVDSRMIGTGQAAAPQPGSAAADNIPAGMRRCPACGQLIKAQAAICRYCRALIRSTHGVIQ